MVRVTLVLLFVLLLNACGQKTLSNVEQGNIDKILHTANGDEPRELDPQLSTGSPEHNISVALFEGLVRKDPKTLAIIPGVAESWAVSDDGKTYRFTIRENAQWSDGVRITANDFYWSWQRALMPNLASEWAYMKNYIKNAEAFYSQKITDFSQVGIKVISDQVLEVELNYPTGFFLQLLDHNSYFPVPKHIVLKHGEMDQAVSNWTRPENFVGNGPFVVTTWKINDVIEVRKNNHYWDAKNVKLNGVNFYPITDKQAEERAFRSGQVHLTQTPQMAVEKIATYREKRPEVLRINPTYSSYYYEFNVAKKPLDDVRVRRAVAMAIDRDSIVKNVAKAGQKPLYSLVPPDPNGYQAKQLFAYDPEKARELLAEAGYPNGDNFPGFELLYNTDDNHRKIALAVQQMLKINLNINIQLMNQEWKVYLNTRKSLEYDFARAGWIADYIDPSNFLEIMHSKSGNNRTAWKSEAFDALIAKAQSTAVIEQRYAIFDQANRILVDEMPVVPLFVYSDVNWVSDDVVNWHGNVMHYQPFNRVDLVPKNASTQ